MFKDETFNTIRRPSIFYRIKSKQGEYLSLLLISDTFGDNSYNIIIKGAFQEFRYILDDYRQKINVSDLSTLCLDTLDTQEFNINKCNSSRNDDCQNMCYLIPKLYGNEVKNICTYIEIVIYCLPITFTDINKEVEIAIFPYFIAKTRSGRENIFFDSNRSELMGGKYNLELKINIIKGNIEYRIPFIQFVIDDALSACIEYIEHYLYNEQ